MPLLQRQSDGERHTDDDVQRDCRDYPTKRVSTTAVDPIAMVVTMIYSNSASALFERINLAISSSPMCRGAARVRLPAEPRNPDHAVRNFTDAPVIFRGALIRTFPAFHQAANKKTRPWGGALFSRGFDRRSWETRRQRLN